MTGRIVPSGDVEAFADNLRDLLGDPLALAAMGEAGAARYRARFRVERMLDATEALYRDVLGVPAMAPLVGATNGNGRLPVT